MLFIFKMKKVFPDQFLIIAYLFTLHTCAQNFQNIYLVLK